MEAGSDLELLQQLVETPYVMRIVHRNHFQLSHTMEIVPINETENDPSLLHTLLELQISLRYSFLSWLRYNFFFLCSADISLLVH